MFALLIRYYSCLTPTHAIIITSFLLLFCDIFGKYAKTAGKQLSSIFTKKYENLRRGKYSPDERRLKFKKFHHVHPISLIYQKGKHPRDNFSQQYILILFVAPWCCLFLQSVFSGLSFPGLGHRVFHLITFLLPPLLLHPRPRLIFFSSPYLSVAPPLTVCLLVITRKLFSHLCK